MHVAEPRFETWIVLQKCITGRVAARPGSAWAGIAKERRAGWRVAAYRGIRRRTTILRAAPVRVVSRYGVKGIAHVIRIGTLEPLLQRCTLSRTDFKVLSLADEILSRLRGRTFAHFVAGNRPSKPTLRLAKPAPCLVHLPLAEQLESESERRGSNAVEELISCASPLDADDDARDVLSWECCGLPVNNSSVNGRCEPWATLNWDGKLPACRYSGMGRVSGPGSRIGHGKRDCVD